LKFKSGRRFSLNSTNIDILRAAFGDESDNWIGIEIELYAGETKYNGRHQGQRFDPANFTTRRPIL
jgi:hypothetical protein